MNRVYDMYVYVTCMFMFIIIMYVCAYVYAHTYQILLHIINILYT